MIRKSWLALLVVASFGSISAAHAQGPAGGGETGAAATIPGGQARAGEAGGVNPATAGSSTLKPETSTTATTPSGTRVDTSAAPGGAVGSKTPDSNAAAPAGR